uniref:Uncharacterized protein n=1 Tax=Cucumis sativus TaxID=3659 RepID=A0A0A0LMX2_CUCSA
MAHLHQIFTSFFPVSSLVMERVSSFNHNSLFVPRVINNVTGGGARMCSQTVVRRSGNYQPSTWKYEFIQSLSSEFEGEIYVGLFNELKGEVRVIMNKIANDDPLKQLEFIDILQRLGISYHFENEIKDMLTMTYKNHCENDDWKINNLYATSLEFRLLRQYGFNIQQDVFNHFFSNETKSFNVQLYEDLNGMLCLYEASFLSIEGENILETAKHFTMEYLEKYMKSSTDENEVAIVRHALELPLHWRMPRLETRWFIDIYERKVDMNPILLEFAKLDFNKVQFIHQQDLKYASRWWKSSGLGQKLSFARDRLIESFFWTVGIGFEPEFSYFRRSLTKINALITIIDDVYDVYGSLDELELFTNAVERDLDELERGDVPKSIQCYMNDTGASESNAREYIRHLIDETWKKLNKTEVENNYSIFPRVFVERAKNLARMAQCMYQYGDGHGMGYQETKDRVMSLLIEPISIHCSYSE